VERLELKSTAERVNTEAAMGARWRAEDELTKARAAVGRLRDRLTLTNAAIEKEYPRMDIFAKSFLVPFVELNKEALTDTGGG